MSSVMIWRSTLLTACAALLFLDASNGIAQQPVGLERPTAEQVHVGISRDWVLTVSGQQQGIVYQAFGFHLAYSFAFPMYVGLQLTQGQDTVYPLYDDLELQVGYEWQIHPDWQMRPALRVSRSEHELVDDDEMLLRAAVEWGLLYTADESFTFGIAPSLSVWRHADGIQIEQGIRAIYEFGI